MYKSIFIYTFTLIECDLKIIIFIVYATKEMLS